MEIKPTQGQPGLFKQELNGVRWTSTFAGPMFNGPYGARRRHGLGAMSLPEDFVKNSQSGMITQSDVPADKTPGVLFTALIPLKTEAIPQPKLDNAFRTAFAQLGYDVSGSSIDLTPVAYQWKYDAANKVWEALPVAGPAEWVRRADSAVILGGNATPTPKDLDNAAKSVETYTLLLRPKDLTISPDKINGIINAGRAVIQANGWSSVLQAVKIQGVEPPPEAPKSIVASIGPWIALIGVGWLATLAARGKVKT